MILLLTNKDDITIDFVVRELQNRGCSYYRLNTEDIPEIVRVSFSINEDSYIIYDTVKRQYINLNDVSAVYFRRPKISDLSHISEISPQEKRYLQSELASLLEGIYKTLRHAFWINDIYRIREAENKIYQLQLAKQIGFEIPQSMISNSVSPLQEILQKSNGNCIIKPIRSGNMGYPDGRQVIFTSQFNESVLDWEDRINAFPSYLQENLNKAYDIRCTVIGDNVFAAAISSQNNPDSCIDWRRSKKPLPHKKIGLPQDIQDKAIEITHTLGLTYSAIDLIMSKQEEFTFLECNPNGQWAWIENRLGYPISEKIVSLLQNV